MATVKNLKINTSTCKRILKELHSYEKEVERESGKTIDMKEKGSHPYDLKQFRRALVMATVRNLKIKTPNCKCILKELHSYEKEVEREAGKTVDMKEKGADPYDLKQQENVLAESRMMVPDCRKRLEGALEDLKGTLVELEEMDEKQGPEFEEARNIIADVEKLFESSEV